MTEKNVSRQRRWQIDRRLRGLCIKCGTAPWREGARFCPRHRETDKARQRSYKVRRRALDSRAGPA